MNQVYKNLALWMVIGLIVILLFTVFQGAQQGGQELPNFSDFLKAVDQGRVESVVIRGNLVTYSLKDSAQTQRTYIVEYPDLIKTLKDRGVRIAVKPPDSNPWYSIFLQWVPMLLFIGVWVFFMRQMQGGGAKALSFGKAWAPPACAICSSRGRSTRPASSSWTRSTRSDATAAPASAVATTSASRRSTSSWSRWTGSRPTRA